MRIPSKAHRRPSRPLIVETANRFARDLIVQESRWRFLQGLGVTLIAADSPDSFLDTTPTAILIRQVARRSLAVLM